ncbi:hypothetical protein KO561_09335 [Radiobacillus kanasensis]|uniref:hypothetical protein n=1 Tax=Radiobacillus kanasensis TaxID=2844358 RepID=UPI001E562984|nr:hypothetical protein [Radiobacillus kanasensis]UFU01115.1 hypothetical protein KO561_09335 [Radiobacillus kanasensis]
MNPNSFYNELPIEFLGVFYYYVFEKFEEYLAPDEYIKEIKIIESVAQARGLSQKELYKIGREISMANHNQTL